MDAATRRPPGPMGVTSASTASQPVQPGSVRGGAPGGGEAVVAVGDDRTGAAPSPRSRSAISPGVGHPPEPVPHAVVVAELQRRRHLAARCVSAVTPASASWASTIGSRSVRVAASSARRPSTATGKVSSWGSTAAEPGPGKPTAASQPTVAAPSPGGAARRPTGPARRPGRGRRRPPRRGGCAAARGGRAAAGAGAPRSPSTCGRIRRTMLCGSEPASRSGRSAVTRS